MILSVLAVAAALAGAQAPPQDAYSGQPRLQVEARDSTDMPLPGATVALCPVDGGHPVVPGPEDGAYQDCTLRYTDAEGFVRFDPVRPGAYAVTASLEGFATTSVYPLLIGGEQPVAPDRVRVYLVAGMTRCGVLPDRRP